MSTDPSLSNLPSPGMNLIEEAIEDLCRRIAALPRRIEPTKYLRLTNPDTGEVLLVPINSV